MQFQRKYPVRPTTKGPSLEGVPKFDIVLPISRSAARRRSNDGRVCGRGVYCGANNITVRARPKPYRNALTRKGDATPISRCE
jgi:hypothetical protein